jgi:hypothetical protein
MNPDHADESDQCDDMPRAVEHALRAHNAINDELCRAVAGEVWQDMQADYDEIYGMWREEMRAARELERERDRLRAAIEQFLAAYPWGPDMPELAGLRAALEGKP